MPNDAGGRPGILLPHIDTVHPIGTLSGPLPFRRDGDKLYGPGLFDMKGGAYLALEAFRQVAQAGSTKLPVTYLFTPDEEVGSPTSRHLIESEARRARYVLVTEPARDGGKIVRRARASAVRDEATASRRIRCAQPGWTQRHQGNGAPVLAIEE